MCFNFLQMNDVIQEAQFRNMFFMSNTKEEVSFLNIQVQRDNLLSDTIRCLTMQDPRNLKKPMKVIF